VSSATEARRIALRQRSFASRPGANEVDDLDHVAWIVGVGSRALNVPVLSSSLRCEVFSLRYFLARSYSSEVSGMPCECRACPPRGVDSVFQKRQHGKSACASWNTMCAFGAISEAHDLRETLRSVEFLHWMVKCTSVVCRSTFLWIDG